MTEQPTGQEKLSGRIWWPWGLRQIWRQMSTPFAKPPERPHGLGRWAPLVCGALICIAFGVGFAFPPRGWPNLFYDALGLVPWHVFSPAYDYMETGNMLTRGALAACAVTGATFVLGPLLFMPPPFAVERQRNTLQDLMLASERPAALVWGRFWHYASAWLGLALLTLPLYVMIGCNYVLSFGASGWSVRLLDFWGSLLGLGSLDTIFAWDMEYIVGGSVGTQLVQMGRWFYDLSGMFLAISVSFFALARSRNTGRARLISSLVVLSVLLTVLSADALWLILARIMGDVMAPVLLGTYWATAFAVVGARFAISLTLVSVTARNRHALAPDEGHG